MPRSAVTLLLSLAFLLAPARASAYSLGSGFTTSCHEVVTYSGLLELIEAADTSTIELPESDVWRRVAAEIGPALRATNPDAPPPEDLTDQQNFLMWSVIVGVRAPDVEGHSVSDLAALREIQADPSNDGQYTHALRGTSDDGLDGDLAAIDGAKRILREVMARARIAKGQPRIVKVPFYLDFYGKMQVDVAELPYLLGRAAHTLQDSYAHMLRSDDAMTVFHVSNYLEAINGTLNESRDGMAHSDSLDDCTRPIDVLTGRASAVTGALGRAAKAYLDGDDGLFEKGLAACDPGEAEPATCSWIDYNPECAAALAAGDESAQEEHCCRGDNAYCGSKWLPIFREAQSKPYLEAVLGCSMSPGENPGSGALGALAALGLAALWRRRGSRANAVCVMLGGMVLGPASAKAATPDVAERAPPTAHAPLPAWKNQPYFVELEGHLSVFSDAPDTSLINMTMGYALRGGYRWGHWGLLGHIERNYWLPTEYSSSLASGALNIGIGGEFFFAGGFARSSITIGPSILLFDTALHDAGRTGFFLDLRPIGVRYPLHEHIVIALDPLTVAYVQPIVFDENVIRLVEYRTVLGVEAVF
jgi:MYXO-CTERM domain-containing protein